MAVAQPLILRQSRWAAKIETTTGTAISLSASDATFIASNGRINYRLPTVRRQKNGVSSNLPAKPSSQAADITMSLEMAGSGSGSLPDWTKFLKAAGWAASSLVLSVATGSATADTLTVGEYVDGRLDQAAGCSFDWTMRFAMGQIPYLDLTGQGCYVAPTAVAIITPTYSTVIPPVVRGITFTIGGTSYITNNIVIAGNNTLYLREDETSSTGFRSCVVTDRDPTLTVSVESQAVGTKDWVADLVAGTEAALSIVIGTGSNTTLTIAAPKIQLRQAPQKGDRNGVLVEDLLFQLNSDGSYTDDSEITLTQS